MNPAKFGDGGNEGNEGSEGNEGASARKERRKTRRHSLLWLRPSWFGRGARASSTRRSSHCGDAAAAADDSVPALWVCKMEPPAAAAMEWLLSRLVWQRHEQAGWFSGCLAGCLPACRRGERERHNGGQTTTTTTADDDLPDCESLSRRRRFTFACWLAGLLAACRQGAIAQ